MLLQPAPAIHTAFMRFAFDAVFMDGTLRVVKVVEQLPPWRTAAARHAWAVLELAAGEVANRGIEVDDQLGVVEISDALGVIETDAGWSGGKWSSVANGHFGVGGRGGGLDDRLDRLRAADATEVSEPTRVLVVATDRRFRSVAAALLTRRGCVVTLEKQTINLSRLARRERPDVVVLEAGSSLTAAAREAAQIETLYPPVGVVVVVEQPPERLSAMRTVAKWGSFDELYSAIERARPTRRWESVSGI
jgi:CheY-like chemotaxis protein